MGGFSCPERFFVCDWVSINQTSNLKCNLGLANAENPIFGLHFSWIFNFILIPDKTPTKLVKILLKKGTQMKGGEETWCHWRVIIILKLHTNCSSQLTSVRSRWFRSCCGKSILVHIFCGYHIDLDCTSSFLLPIPFDNCLDSDQNRFLDCLLRRQIRHRAL